MLWWRLSWVIQHTQVSHVWYVERAPSKVKERQKDCDTGSVERKE